MYFQYGEKELTYLKQKDKRLAAVIEQIGFIKRETDDDLFASVVHHIVGQQISSKAQATVWARLQNYLGIIEPQTVNAAPAEALQALGMSMRKALYIKDFAARVVDGSFDLEAVKHMEDQEAIAALSSLKGIGVWTAEMILLFCLQRRDILSFDDLAIQRGLRMLYHHRKITKELFARYRRRYSPYGSVASLYLWAIAGGAVEGMKDYGAQKKINKKQ
ncbi:MAG: DNA-3-methyladenine glycosylase [Phascolarctobacterium sp.]|uniref:DNA-3-methyladenine glycosylase family protein n=1 Tax=Phascolarctobacterium sp. TaxID=2049039 RepID=UPI0026DD1C36|nr:DNA-3-methyladenine glycosylase [Phascolarctobacterium sp.]MDO4921845.1 DNA-3-methyladenine glycosylase [Phascolarctobacterium sp.]